jgi:hypothetical protein
MSRTMVVLQKSAFKTVEMTSDLVSIFLTAGSNEGTAGRLRYRPLVMPYQTALRVS